MKIKNNIVEIMIIVGVSLLLFYSSDPVVRPDTPRYLSGSLLDPPMYSSIIILMETLFGTLKSVVVFQTIFIGFGIIYFTKTMTTKFNLDFLIKVLVSLFLFLPIIQFYDNLLTEPFSYAFSLLFVSFVVKIIFDLNVSNLICFIIFAVALLLTRNQFMFIYPVILLIFLGIFILNSSKKIAVWLTSSFIGIFLIHNSIIFLNTYANQDLVDEKYVLSSNKNWTESLTYVSLGPSYFLYIDAIYISNLEDSQIFENQNLRETLNTIFNEMKNRESLNNYYDGRGHFGKSLTDIREYSNPLLIKLAREEGIAISSLKREIAITLISSNFDKYIKHVFKKFYDSTWLFVFVPFFILLTASISFFNHKSHFSLVIISISLFALANHSVVYLFGRIQPRYLIYSDFILLVFIIILFSIFLKKEKNKFL